MVDVVVLQDHLFPLDQRVRGRRVEGVERGAEMSVHPLIAVTERDPVAAQLADAVALSQDLHIVDVVRSPDLRHAGRSGSRSSDAENPVLQTSPVPIPDQRDLRLGVGHELVVIVPRWYPKFCVRRVECQPVLSVLIVQKTSLAIDELPSVLYRQRGGLGSRILKR